MKTALAKVRDAMAVKNIVLALTALLVHDGMIYASDGRMTAAAPFPRPGTFLVPGAEFCALVDRFPDDTKLVVHEDHVELRFGRTRATVKTFPVESKFFPAPEGAWQTPPSGLLAALTKVRPFISDNATQPWALCANLVQDGLLATTNIALVFVDLPGLAPPANTLLPCWAIDFVLKRTQVLTGVILDPLYIAFQWDDGSWLRTQLIAGQFPDGVYKLLENAPSPDVAITAQWRNAYNLVAELSEDFVTVSDELIVGRNGAAMVEQEASLPELMECPTAWTLRFTNPVIAVATHWAPSYFPQPVAFKGDGIHGLIMGRSV